MKEVERQIEVRLATWFCEAIEDSIKRFQTSAGEAAKMAREDAAHAEEEEEKSKDPAWAKVANPDFIRSKPNGGKNMPMKIRRGLTNC